MNSHTRQPIRVWLDNNSGLETAVTWSAALDAFSVSKWSSRSLKTFRSVEERLNVLMNHRYGSFIAPDSSSAQGNPSMSAEDYRDFIAAAESRMRD